MLTLDTSSIEHIEQGRSFDGIRVFVYSTPQTGAACLTIELPSVEAAELVACALQVAIDIPRGLLDQQSPRSEHVVALLDAAMKVHQQVIPNQADDAA